MTEHSVAHVDEAGARLPNGRRLYVIAAVLTTTNHHLQITSSLTALQETDLPLHYRAERFDRRVAVAKTLAEAPLHGAILLTTSSSNSGQEQARAMLLCELLPRLEHIERVERVVLESRAGGDRHDRRTRDRLRRSHQISVALQVDHANKTVPMLWPADWIASAYVAAHHHDEWEPWEVMCGAHMIEITALDPR